MADQADCPTPAQHNLHLCQLKAKPLNDEVRALFSDPKFVCTNCGNSANRAENLCAPKPL